MVSNKTRLLIVGLIAGIFIFSAVNFSVNNVAASNNVVRRPPWETDKAPTVAITSPANGENVEGIVLITVSASDDKGIISVSLSIDGATFDVTGSLQFNWDTAGVADGDHSISATATDTIGQTASASITVTTGEVTPPPPPPEPTGNKFAVIVGISDYKAISDLSFCDEDATDWYNFLEAQGYYIVAVLGDGHPEDYPRYDGTASESNIRAALAEMNALAGPGDTCVFTTSGHGGEYKIGRGPSATYQQYLCCWDCSSGEDGQDGILWDDEFPALFADFTDKNFFVFYDHCYSGGFYDEAVPSNWFITSTCTNDGYGYDMTTYSNGAWTYFFLEATLANNPSMSMEDAYAAAAAIYPYDGGDFPQMFDGNTAYDFYL